LVTVAGTAARERIEQETDSAAAGPWEALGAEATDRLAAVLTPLAHAIIDQGAFPLPNPIGAVLILKRAAQNQTFRRSINREP
jgi:hypothetical protein